MVAQDRAFVRHLAEQVAELANRPENALVIKRWRDVNAGRKPDRYPVWCRPVGAWQELLPDSRLECRDPWYRRVEKELRMILIKAEIGDDTPIYARFTVPAKFKMTPKNIWGIDALRHEATEKGGSWGYASALATAEDYDRLCLPQCTYDSEATRLTLQKAQDALGDILSVQLSCAPPLGATTLTTTSAQLRGLTELMLDMVDAPQSVHRLMAHLRDGVLQVMDAVEATGLLTPNNDEPMTCSDPLGDTAGPLTYKNLWNMANSQEFGCVSPAMWEEFLLQYQLPIMARFGATAYGCCEDLTHKIDGVLAIPNLRIFVCSAWTHLPTVVERVGNRCCIMWRQKASDVVFAPDPATLRAQLREGLQQLKGCSVQIVLRELQTLAGNMDRLHVWTRLAIEEAERVS